MPDRLLPIASPPRSGPAAAPPRGWSGAGRAVGPAARATPTADDLAPRLSAAVGTRPALARGTAVAPGAAAGMIVPYGVAAYLAADALRARPHDEAVEVSVRHTGDGGRLTVARRTAGAQTVAIEAQIA